MSEEVAERGLERSFLGFLDAETLVPEYLFPREVTIKVIDEETEEPIPNALVMGAKLVVPILPRRTNDKGETVIYTRLRMLGLLVVKKGYKPTIWSKRIGKEMHQSYVVKMEKREE